MGISITWDVESKLHLEIGNGTAIMRAGPPRVGFDSKWDRQNAFKRIRRLDLEVVHHAPLTWLVVT